MQSNVCCCLETLDLFASELAEIRSPLPGKDNILTKKKSRRSAVHPLPATPMKPQKTCEVLPTATNLECLAPMYQNELDCEYINTPGTLLDVHHTKRKSNRTRTNGIVALTNFAKPVVAKIYDIAPGGISFLCTNELDIADSALQMDILIFDILTNFEYLINEIKGCIKSKKLVADPKSKIPTWRYSVAFVDLDSVNQNRLKILFNRIPQANDHVSYERYLKATYDS